MNSIGIFAAPSILLGYNVAHRYHTRSAQYNPLYSGGMIFVHKSAQKLQKKIL